MKLAKVMKLTKALKMIIQNEISVNDLENFSMVVNFFLDKKFNLGYNELIKNGELVPIFLIALFHKLGGCYGSVCFKFKIHIDQRY